MEKVRTQNIIRKTKRVNLIRKAKTQVTQQVLILDNEEALISFHLNTKIINILMCDMNTDVL